MEIQDTWSKAAKEMQPIKPGTTIQRRLYGMKCSSAAFQDAPGPGFSWGCSSCSAVEQCGEETDINSESEWGERWEVGYCNS